MSGSAKRRTELALRQIARLTIERAQVLRYSAAARGKRAAVFFAPSTDPTLQSNYELLRCAVGEAGLVATYFDVARLADVSRLKDELRSAHALVVLDDDAFRNAPFAKTNVICACQERPDLDWTVIRLGDPSDHEDIEFYLDRGHALEILDAVIWDLGALFLMQSIGRGEPAGD